MSSLDQQLKRFLRWANQSAPDGVLRASAEWECEYPFWPELYSAVRSVLEQPFLSHAEEEQVLFALARDNEAEVILDLLASFPTHVLALATRALQSTHPDARWQAAVAIARAAPPGAIPVLRLFLSDSDEYVRRRALLALGRLDASLAEEAALQWLSASLEYSRMAALVVLQIVGSPKLEAALSALNDDPSEVVRNRVHLIRAGHSPEA
jgi:HEAT repeat protein